MYPKTLLKTQRPHLTEYLSKRDTNKLQRADPKFQKKYIDYR